MERLGQYSAAIDWTELRTTFFGRTPDAPSPELAFGESDPQYATYPRFRDYEQGVVSQHPFPSGSETALIEKAHRGVQTALDQLNSLYSREIRGFLRARVRNSFDVDDIAQETWITLTKRIDQFDPSRGDFGAFVKYWANITALRWYHDRGRMAQVTRLFSELTSQGSAVQDVPDIGEIVPSQDISPEEAIARSEQYNNLIWVTFSTASPPHQLLAFAYCKLLEWRPRDVVERLSDAPLRELADRFESAYKREVPYAEEALRRVVLRMHQNLSLPVKEISDPATTKLHRSILGKAAADTRFRDYYRVLPEQNVSHWVYAVRRRALALLKEEKTTKI